MVKLDQIVKEDDIKDKFILFNGISLINAEDSIAGAVFFFAGSRTILYFLTLFFLSFLWDYLGISIRVK